MAMLLRFFESKTFEEWCLRCKRCGQTFLRRCQNFWCCPCAMYRTIYGFCKRYYVRFLKSRNPGLYLHEDDVDAFPNQRTKRGNRETRKFTRTENGMQQNILRKVEALVRMIWPRWYWFLLAGQVGFMVREAMVVSMLDGWYIDVLMANIAIWVVIILTAKQVWQFSYYRQEAKKAIDQILDILLLPINYGFICCLCVRTLRLQSTEQNQSMSQAMLHTADIWESWALWSVLKLFARIVDYDSAEENRKWEWERALRQDQSQQKRNSTPVVQESDAPGVIRRSSSDPVMPSSADHTSSPTGSLSKSIMTPPVRFEEHGDYPDYVENDEVAAAHQEAIRIINCVTCTAIERVMRMSAGITSPMRDQTPPKFLKYRLRTPPKFWDAECRAPFQDLENLRYRSNPPLQRLRHTTTPEVGLHHLHFPCGYTGGSAASSPIPCPDFAVPQGFRNLSPGRGSPSRNPFHGVGWPGGEGRNWPSRTPSPPKLANFASTTSSRTVDFHTQPQDKPVVKVLSSASPGSGPGAAKRYIKAVNAIKTLSLSGVQFWVWSLLVVNVVEITLKGVIAVHVPTLCYLMSGGCQSCDAWYTAHVSAVAEGVVYILCCFAIGFVLAFERQFDDYLEKIEPYWKFWGVKILVTFTYFQNFIISWLFKSEPQISLYHCTLCCLELPVLCILHATKAYQAGYRDKPSPWIKALLDAEKGGALTRKASRHNLRASISDGDGDDASSCSTPRSEESSSTVQCFLSNFLSSGHPWFMQVQTSIRMSGYVVISVFSCYSGIQAVLFFVPMGVELPSQQDSWYNFTCHEDVTQLVRHKTHDLNWVVPAGMTKVGHPWLLPLCSVAQLSCKQGWKGNPSIKCSAGGVLQVNEHEECQEVVCGPPPGIPHARPTDVSTANRYFRPGMTVKYKCDTGYSGGPIQMCQADGTWSWWSTGTSCQMVGCGPLDQWLLYTLGKDWRTIMEPTSEHWLVFGFAGQSVSFVCQPGFRGNPSVFCAKGEGQDEQRGSWNLMDQCRPFKTAVGCECEDHWVFCRGWFGTDCSEYNGCAKKFVSSRSWCQVRPGSCPSSAKDFWDLEPFGDYCVPAAGDQSNSTAQHRRVANQGVKPEQLYSTILFFLLLVTFMLCSYSWTHNAMILRMRKRAWEAWCRRKSKCKNRWDEYVLALRQRYARDAESWQNRKDLLHEQLDMALDPLKARWAAQSAVCHEYVHRCKAPYRNFMARANYAWEAWRNAPAALPNDRDSGSSANVVSQCQRSKRTSSLTEPLLLR